MMRWRPWTSRAALLAAAGTAIAAWLALGPVAEFHLPARIDFEEEIANLLPLFQRDAVVAEAPQAPVHPGGLKPGAIGASGGYRRTLVTPAPSVVRFRLRVPRGAVLRTGMAVAGEGKRDAEATGVRFTVSIDGHAAFSRVINPAATRHDRRWFDERIPLPAWVDGEVEIMLATELAQAGRRPAGTSGWSRLRVVREVSRERQAVSLTAPNLLVLLVDALRADRLGCSGRVPSPSPTLDRLAAGGLLFEQAVAQAPWTLPSVASILTGLHPRSHGVLGQWKTGDAVTDADASDPAFLPDALRTLPEYALRAGITTVGVSGNPLVSRGTNLARGFETFVEFGWDRERRDWPRAAEINDRFLRWLTQNRRHRFLAYLHYMDPHDPYTPPEALRPPAPSGLRAAVAAGDADALARGMSAGKLGQLAPPEVDHLRRLYDGEIAYWDGELARLLEGLAAHGVRESTVILVTADHGEEFQEHGRLKHGAHLYEESIRVPLVIAGPSVTPARIRAMVQGIDVLPTALAILGLTAPPELPGRNLLASPGERPAVSETRFGASSDGGEAALVSLRTGGWKLIHAPALGRFELYDLRRDPGERDNRFGTAPEAGALVEQLAAWQAAAPTPPATDGHDPQLHEKLRALGYVE